MLAKCAPLLLCYHLLLYGALSEFTPTDYPAKIVSSHCGQHNHFDEQLSNVLRQIKQQLPVQNVSCKSILDNYPSAPCRLLPHHYYQWLLCSGLLRHGGDQLWRRGRLDEGGLCQHDTTWCYLPTRIGTKQLH